MQTEIIIAGQGGQGVLELGNYVSYYALLRGKHVAYTPSYGPESRGGKVKCYVVVSEKDIDSPVVEEPDYLIVMNNPSMDFVPLLKKGGHLLMNSSLIERKPEREDISVLKIPATELADKLRKTLPSEILGELTDTKLVSNSVMLGSYLADSGEEFDRGTVEQVFAHFLTGRKSIYIPLNLEALKRGYEFDRSTYPTLTARAL